MLILALSDFICDIRYTTVNDVYENVADPLSFLVILRIQHDDTTQDTCCYVGK